MADYFGLEAIARRMGVTQTTMRQWIDHRAFIAYHRGRRGAWYTNDALISTWEIAQASISRQRRARKTHELRALAKVKAGLDAPASQPEPAAAHA